MTEYGIYDTGKINTDEITHEVKYDYNVYYDWVNTCDKSKCFV